MPRSQRDFFGNSDTNTDCCPRFCPCTVLFTELLKVFKNKFMRLPSLWWYRFMWSVANWWRRRRLNLSFQFLKSISSFMLYIGSTLQAVFLTMSCHVFVYFVRKVFSIYLCNLFCAAYHCFVRATLVKYTLLLLWHPFAAFFCYFAVTCNVGPTQPSVPAGLVYN